MEDRKINCLDKGFVRLVDWMGDDAAIVQAARVSYGKGTKKKSEDRGLIRYLVRMKHTSPLEMVEFKFHCKMPIFVARQWIRHRTASLNEYSGRYSEMKQEWYVPEASRLQKQSQLNKQGSSAELIDNSADWRTALYYEGKIAFTDYQAHLEADMAKELARINLPLSTYTEWYWKMDLHNLLHFLRLRMDSHAQYEIRVYAEAIYELIKPIVPMSCEAFEDYIWNAKTFSAQEMKIIDHIRCIANIDPSQWEIRGKEAGLSKREILEMKSKFNLGY